MSSKDEREVGVRTEERCANRLGEEREVSEEKERKKKQGERRERRGREMICSDRSSVLNTLFSACGENV
jgi:hypothetical protein